MRAGQDSQLDDADEGEEEACWEDEEEDVPAAVARTISCLASVDSFRASSIAGSNIADSCCCC